MISKITPSGGPAAGGTVVTIDGESFMAGATVTVGGASCATPVFVSSTRMTCTTRAHALGLVDVIVTNPNTMSASLPGGFSYRTAPTVSAVTPANGPQGGGTWITVTGTGFARGVRATVGVGSCSELLLISSTQLGCYTPSRADSGGVAITVTNDDSQFGTGATFTYDQPPAVTNKMCANTASAELTGVLYDSGGASGNYINNNNQCEFRITAPPGKAITLSFSAFDLQEGGD
ncbi:MAG TPA: IPT/TIG domain-containing protein, partial [Bdellovibrionota bacterium]|nr:IPT/TIG domain-containing protein [Bdellovibrionota bacterium]